MHPFRASPWVTYAPSSSSTDTLVSGHIMDKDVDMDAPQISTLQEDGSASPPAPSTKPPPTKGRKRPAPPSTSDNGIGDDEEDQLLDELVDDVADPKPSIVESPKKRKLTVIPSRKPRKPPTDVDNNKDTGQSNGVLESAPTMSAFRANPIVSYEPPANNAPAVFTVDPSSTKAKKATPRKAAIPRARKAAKQKSAIPPLLLQEDAGALSESYAGTAASSPIAGSFGQNSPEPDVLAPSSPALTSAPALEETLMNLENVPIPVYPLPTKPFPVQPPPKIPTGSAPTIPLDKGGRKVRHWREANREIRGIAGGRWLVKTWVGEKESDFATSQGKEEKHHSGLTSVSTPSVKAIGKLKAPSKAASAATSATQSRATSAVPEPTTSNPVTSAVRAPTKMRIIHQAESDAGDSDVMTATVGA